MRRREEAEKSRRRAEEMKKRKEESNKQITRQHAPASNNGDDYGPLQQPYSPLFEDFLLKTAEGKKNLSLR